MDKAAEAFRNIGEVSEELGVRKHVLRFWEMKFPQLKPMKRGGGRRLYRPSDVELLRGIRHLLQNAGYTIKGVQRILRERGVDAVKVSGTGRVISVGGGDKPRAESPLLLNPVEVRALREVAETLDACLQTLAHGAEGERHCERAAKR